MAKEHDGMDKHFVRQVSRLCREAVQLQLEGEKLHAFVASALMAKYPQWNPVLIKEKAAPVVLYYQYTLRIQVTFSPHLVQHILQHVGQLVIIMKARLCRSLLHSPFCCSSAM